MAAYSNVQCLYCRANEAQKVADQIWEQHQGRAIYPQKIRRAYNEQAKKWEEKKEALLPGYVFLYENEKPIARAELLSMKGIIRILSYDNERATYLCGHDLAFANWIWETKIKIDRLRVTEKDGYFEIADEAYKAFSGAIHRVDRRWQTCQVVIEDRSVIRSFWLPYEVVEPLK